MRPTYLTVSIFLILLNVNNCCARIKSRGSKTNVPKKPYSSIPKTNHGARPKQGQLFFKGGHPIIQLNQTDEFEVYAANFSMFPSNLFYTGHSTDNDVGEFLTACMNTTLEADVNRDQLLKLRSSGEVHMRVVTRVIDVLCLENYHRQNSSAHLLPGGLWEIFLTSIISLILKWLA